MKANIEHDAINKVTNVNNNIENEVKPMPRYFC